MIAVNVGLGTNSIACVVEAHNRGIRPDFLAFADTGSEMPHTYKYIALFDAWLLSVGFPPLTRVRWIRQTGEFIPLHVWCEEGATLPSKAFGFSGCTSKWKQQPIDKFFKNHPLIAVEHEQGRRVERWIGFDADEPHRAERMFAKDPDNHLWEWRAPLVEWGLGRDECVEVIARAGLPQPGKSSCFMCPSMKKHEIVTLTRRYPELAERALVMEARAKPNLDTVKGLGRTFAWGDYLAGNPQAIEAPEVVEVECACFDGEDDLAEDESE